MQRSRRGWEIRRVRYIVEDVILQSLIRIDRLAMAELAARQKHFLSDKVSHFTESVIREMTRQAMLYGAINLAQGFPDFPAPAEIKRAAQEAVANDINQYAITWGARNLRQAIARQTEVWQGISADPETEMTVCW